jgi:hypothetical protein
MAGYRPTSGKFRHMLHMSLRPKVSSTGNSAHDDPRMS